MKVFGGQGRRQDTPSTAGDRAVDRGSLAHDERAFLGTLNLILIVALLGGLAALVWWVTTIDFSAWSENLGEQLTSGATGFASGAIGSLFSFGQSIGSKWNPFD